LKSFLIPHQSQYFARQNGIKIQRNMLIEQLEEQLEQRVQMQVLFNLE